MKKSSLFLASMAVFLITNSTIGQPTEGLSLWLKADAGLTLNGTGVSVWADQSGLGTDAVQDLAESQPTLVTDGANGRPVLLFDGTNDFLTFNLPIDGLDQMTIFVVANTSMVTGGGGSQAERAAIFWNEHVGWGTVYVTPFQQLVRWRFGTGTTGSWNTYTRPVPLESEYTVTTARHDGTSDPVRETLHVNGNLVQERTTGQEAILFGNRDEGNIGRGYNDNTYFAGGIAEVMVYTRALPDTEREEVEEYLLAKYSINQPPAVSITTPEANTEFTAPGSIAITAQASDADGTISKVEFFASGTKVGEDTSGPDYSFTWSEAPAGSYSLTAVATDDRGASTTSAAVAVAVNPSGGAVPTYSGLALWLKGDAGLTLNGSTVSEWADQSGQARHAVQAAAANQPTAVTAGIGKPGVRFDGINDFLTFNLPVNGLTGMTIILVANSTVASADGGARAAIFWNETASWSGVHVGPFQTQVNFRFGNTQVGNSHDIPRAQPIGADYSLTTTIHNESVDSLYVNGELLFEEGDKGATLTGNRDVGNLGRGYNDNSYFGGDILEVLVYARALNETERRAIESYLQTKYLTNQLPTVSLASPAEEAEFAAPASITLTAQAMDPDGAISKVEFFASGTKVGEATTAPYSFTWTNVPAGNYTLTAVATDNGGAYRESAGIRVLVTSPDGLPLAGLGLWLKADAGVTLNGSSVSQWDDQSGLGRHAVQATSGSQPMLVADAANGQPGLVFDGVDDFLTFNFPINGLQDMTIFLVSACSEDIDVGFPFAGRGALFWNETASWGTTYLSPFQSVVRWRFGTGQVQDLVNIVYTHDPPKINEITTTTVLRDGSVSNEERLFVDGELVTTLAIAPDPETNQAFVLANNTDTGNVGRGYNDNTYFPGTVAEVLIYTRALSDTERQRVERYLMDKYAERTLLDLAISFSEGNVVISWTGNGTLEEADSVSGPWTASTSQANPQTVTPSGAAKFFRIRQ